MKLLYKINIQYLIYSSIIIIIGAGIIYFLIRAYSIEEAEESLYLLKNKAVKNIEAGKHSDFFPIVEIDTISMDDAKNIVESVTDTLVYLKYAHEHELFLQLTSPYIKDGIGYRIFVRTTNINNEDILFSIGLPILSLLILILLTSLFVVYRINYSIWKPFYKNITNLKRFSASDNKPVSLVNYDVEEFIDLNNCLMELTEKIRKDYNNLKTFSENISHELQTPLAIIKTKTELMLQDPLLGDEKIRQIQIINQTVNRLSKLNSSLILLMKIESADFAEKKTILLNDFILKKIEEIQEIADFAGLNISSTFNDSVSIEINENLLDIMFSNLFGNAIKHNYDNGKIEVILCKNKFVIKNTGKELLREPSTYFERFARGEFSSSSTGLGLTIVKQICDLNKCSINYIYKDKYHSIEISFN